MTKALMDVFSILNKMPVIEQDAIAGLLKEELAWEISFSSSQKELSILATEAMLEFKKSHRTA